MSLNVKDDYSDYWNQINKYDDSYVNANSKQAFGSQNSKNSENAGRSIWKFGKDLNTASTDNDSKFTMSEGLKNFGKGLMSNFTSLIQSPKNLLMGTIAIAGALTLAIATGGALTPLLIAAGATIGTLQLGTAAFKFLAAKDGDEREQVMFDVGAGVGTLALSVAGAKPALKAAGAATDGLNPVSATIECIKSSPASIKNSVTMIKDGTALTNINNVIGSIKKSSPVELEPGENNPLNIHKLENAVDIKPYNAERPVQISLAGYSAAPEGYEGSATQFTEAVIKEIGTNKVSITTSPTADKASIDAIGTAISQKDKLPLRYITAEDYLGYIDKTKFPEGIDIAAYDKATKFYFPTTQEYSAATAQASNSIIVEGGRDAAVSDFINSINKGNRAVIADLSANEAWNPAKNRVDNASRYIIEQLSQYAKDGTLKHQEAGGFTLDFLKQNYEKIHGLAKIVDNTDPAAIKQAAEHLHPSQNFVVPDTLAVRTRIRTKPFESNENKRMEFQPA